VFFDNLQVVQTRGQILEETHYYPFGLTMSGISSKAAGVLENKKNKFQNQEFDDDLGINYYEFKWRNHDPQIGRFIQIDPLANDYVYNSTYAFSENKVTNHVELEGLEAVESMTLRNEKRYFSGEITEAQYSRNIKTQATAGVVTGGFVFSLMFPTVAAPIIAAEVFGVPSPTAPTSMAGTVASEVKTAVTLEQRATEIQGVLKPGTQSRTTTAVASATTAEGQSATLVGFSEKNLRPVQRASLKPGEIPVSGVGHAETTILNHAKANGMTVSAVGASRPICSGCATAINNAGAVPASPLKIMPAVADATYRRPSIVTPLK